MHIIDDGEQDEIEKDDFIGEVLEILFGYGAVIGEETERNFSYSEAIKELKTMNDIYTQHIVERDWKIEKYVKQITTENKRRNSQERKETIIEGL